MTSVIVLGLTQVALGGAEISLVGETVSHYRISERLGVGGMGVVYKALDTRLGRSVALKFLPEEMSHEDAGVLERFEREARAASALNHPNICVVHDFDQYQGRPFIVMELLEGRTLKTLIEEDGLGLNQVLDIGVQVCHGLEAAHALGVVHRDIKPANIFVTGGGIVKIVDFGLAKLTAILVADNSDSSMPTPRVDSDSLTRPGVLVGTVSYMSPEQAMGEPVDARSDIFSLGLTLYEALTGRLPFQGKTLPAYINELVHKDPAAPSTVKPSLPVRIDPVVTKALRKQRGERYQTAGDFRADLVWLQRGKSPTPLHFWRDLLRGLLGRFEHRTRILMIVVAMALAILTVSIADWEQWLGSKSARRDIAVLPFVNIVQSDEREAEALGLTYDVTSALTRVQRFRNLVSVVPASEVIGMGCNSPGQARSYFDVDLVVTGSLEWTDTSVRFTLNLVDAETVRQRDSEVIVEPIASIQRLPEEVIRQLDRMLEMTLDPGAFEVLAAGGTQVASAYEQYQRGVGYLERNFQSGSLERAEQAFRRALEEDGQFAAAHAGLSMTFFRQFQQNSSPESLASADTECREALHLDAQLAAAHVACASVAAARGKRREAAEGFRRAHELEPRNLDALSGLAVNLDPSSAEAAEAERRLRAIVDTQPDSWYGHYQLGLFSFYQGRYEDALNAFREAQADVPGNYKVHNNMGAANLNLGRYDGATENFLNSNQILPNYIAFTNLGTIRVRERDYAAAVDMYRRALELNDSDYTVWGNLASACRQVPSCKVNYERYYARAADMVARKLELNPNDAWLKADRADYLSQLEAKDESRQLLEEALDSLDTAPEPAELAYLGAQIYVVLGNGDAAFRWLEKALDRGLPWARVAGSDSIDQLRDDSRYRRLADRFAVGSAAGKLK